MLRVKQHKTILIESGLLFQVERYAAASEADKRGGMAGGGRSVAVIQVVCALFHLRFYFLVLKERILLPATF